MDVTKKFSPTTWPDHPEKITMEGKNKFIGFWLFLGGEVVIFGCLFATYLALRNHVPDANMAKTQDLFELPIAFLATMFLLTSSLTSVYAMYHMKNYAFQKMQLWLFVTFALGVAFLCLEIYEFTHYIKHFKFTMQSSAFGSAFYTLVGTHGAHVAFGLAWFATLMIRNSKRGLYLHNAPKFFLASLYWHFIDVVWVFIFTVVYLMGMI